VSRTQLRTRGGQSTTVSDEAIAALAELLRGRLVLPSDADYDQTRSVWNGMVDRRPALIVQCAGVADVVTTVNFAKEHDLLVAVRGGGHNAAGNAVCDDGLVIDLSLMKGVRVDPLARTVRAEGGVTIGELDHESQAFGLAVPMGVVTETGIAGLTLAGGIGWLRRKYGLSCDNLISADVVTANGELVTASSDNNADLLWALQGGGGNFGVVTSFEFRAYPVGPDVFFAFAIHPGTGLDARAALQFYASGANRPPMRSVPSRSFGMRQRSRRFRPSTTANRLSFTSRYMSVMRRRVKPPYSRCGTTAHQSLT
jgi:FAD/FMN-containing dehydrogenase